MNESERKTNENEWTPERSFRKYANPETHREFEIHHSPYEDAETERERLRHATAGQLMKRCGNGVTSFLTPAARKRIQESE